MSDNVKELECCTHGKSFATFVCSHLVSRENSEWYSSEPDEDDEWPDSWCSDCNIHFEAEGEWNDKAEAAAGGADALSILCHKCYEDLREECNVNHVE